MHVCTRDVQLSRYIRLSRYHKTYRHKDDKFIINFCKLLVYQRISDGVATSNSWGHSGKTITFVLFKLQFAHFTGYILAVNYCFNYLDMLNNRDKFKRKYQDMSKFVITHP